VVHCYSHFVTDIDECTDFNGDCEHNCTNTNGSYYCTCDEGYTLDKDGHNCTKHTNWCEHLNCIALLGSPIGIVIIVALAGEHAVDAWVIICTYPFTVLIVISIVLYKREQTYRFIKNNRSNNQNYKKLAKDSEDDKDYDDDCKKNSD